ncbi:fumarylacetoacetate hydrolase family protein [Gaiella sp.]|jgi:2-dehydro-3-deoxy-D-arabinonate dehydratase|uniref:fumarylacetoacetate hydrolase family protein n=1 Tax=Gaiella sp. TaxID=2663207 RepID=UPI002E36227F|nr:fumarylacetoacetate hydrolase family protein [Gaiella sp.]HEX5585267.1 fumarylacetoacetate hydrolase family protein [Gaiella sp.]
MRRIIRWADPEGYVSVGVEHSTQGQFSVLRGLEDPLPMLLGDTFPLNGAVVPVDPYSLELEPPLTLLPPIDAPEVWAAGATYERGRSARMEASPFWDVYAAVHEMHRPELFLKDAASRRTVGPGAAIGIRGDSTWNAPEPEIALVLGPRGSILGYTIGNDVSSREIESASPLYLSQAKVYAGSCAIGPAIYVPEREPHGFEIVMRISDEDGDVLYQETATTTDMERSFTELASWLFRDNPIPTGTVLLTGAGLVPPDDVNLLPGHWVEIHVPEIGTLVNHVVVASELA